MKQIIILTLLALLMNGCILRHPFYGHRGGYYNDSYREHSYHEHKYDRKRDRGRLHRDSHDYRR
ncbi:hypothetical protein KKC13_10955 [bacterium]|nr:hypothetical protein [bacterium]MBU1958186.1 hypothetical protein [bacterium]